MPAIGYAAPAALAARDLFDSTGSSSINTKTILIIIFVAIVPVLIVASVVGWLLCSFSRGRGCCGRRKNNGSKSKTPPATPQKDQEIAAVLRPSPDQNPEYWQNEPVALSRPVESHARNDSMKSQGSGTSERSMNEKTPALPQGFV